MKNKVILVVLVLAVFAVPAFLASQNMLAVQTSSAVQLPEELKLLISGLILAAVTLGLQAVFDWIHLDLRGMGAAIAATVSGFAIAQLQGFIDLVPAAYDQWVSIGLTVLVVVLSGIGVLRALFNRVRAEALA